MMFFKFPFLFEHGLKLLKHLSWNSHATLKIKGSKISHMTFLSSPNWLNFSAAKLHEAIILLKIGSRFATGKTAMAIFILKKQSGI